MTSFRRPNASKTGARKPAPGISRQTAREFTALAVGFPSFLDWHRSQEPMEQQMGKQEISPAVMEEIRSGRLAKLGPQELLKWGFDRFFPRIALSASFGSPDGMVLL